MKINNNWRFWRKIVLITILLLGVVSLGILSREYIKNLYVRTQLNDLAAPGKGDRLLVIAPHNDDEVLGAGELISQTLKNGGQVKVVMMTNGDGYKRAIMVDYLKINPQPADFIKFGYLRQKETIAALKLLGLPRQDIFFLGYPDGGLSLMWNENWLKNQPYLDAFTQVSRSPYANSFTKNAEFCGASISADLEKIIADFQPTYISCPHPNDAHPDHWATYNFAKYAQTILGYHPAKEWLYLVHQGEWPAPLAKEPALFLVPPAQLLDDGTVWQALPLNPAQISEKEKAISQYKSQTKLLGPLLHAFLRKNELFGEYAPAVLFTADQGSDPAQPDSRSKIITAPVHYYYRLQVDKNGAISSVYAEKNQAGELNIYVTVGGEIESNPTFHLNMIFFQESQARHLKLEITNNQIRGVPFAGESTPVTAAMKAVSQGNLLHITIPPNAMGSWQKIFLNVATSIGPFNLDQTAWKMVEGKEAGPAK